MKTLYCALVRLLAVPFGLLFCNPAAAYTIDGSASFLNIHGTTQVDIVGGAQVAFLDAFDQVHIDVKGGDTSWLTLHDEATISVTGGELSWLTLYDETRANITGGDISWIRAYDKSYIRLSNIDDLSWLVFEGTDSRAEIVGSDITYSNGHLSGIWTNGTPFSFWAVHGYAATSALPSNIVIASVPEPGTLILMSAASLFALLRKRQRA